MLMAGQRFFTTGAANEADQTLGFTVTNDYKPCSPVNRSLIPMEN
jgi:hypothetical protein